MGNCLSISHRRKTETVPDIPSPVTTSPPATSTRPDTIPSRSYPKYDVFISHAGEDRSTIAIPLREKLLKCGITAFVYEEDIDPGADAQDAMVHAMETASVAVIVLSPEFVARKWPIMELLCFLRRLDEHDSADGEVPAIIPFFYRLSISDLYQEPRFDRLDKDGNSLYVKSRFVERMKKGEPEADIATIKASLQRLHRLMGVRNDFEASNDSAHIMYRRREVLLQDLFRKIQKALNTGERSRTGYGFHAHFDTAQETSDLIFDFWNENEERNTSTQEAKLLEAVLDESDTDNRSGSIAVRGIGGVGKTSLMRGLSCLSIVKQHFRDGVHNLSLGRDGTRLDLIRELSKAVERSGGREEAASLRREEKLEDVFKGFWLWFENRKCLFIIDDVWQTKENPASVIDRLLKLHLSGKGSKVIVTTRSTDIASRAKFNFCLEPRGSTDIESRTILLQYAEVKPENAEDHKVMNEILEECSGLPLFLAVAGKAIKALTSRRGHEGCAAYHAYLESLRGNLQTMLRTDVDLHERLDASLKISLDLLEERTSDFSFEPRVSVSEMYGRLSVVKKRSKVPMRMLKFLWELDHGRQAAVIAGEFEKVGLADVEFEKQESGYVELLGIHDSLFEFAVMETRTFYEEREIHETLLRGYGQDLAISDGCREWWHNSLEADGYIHQNLCRHLLGAGRALELVSLLLRPQWTKRQVKISGVLFLVADFSVGIISIQDRIRERRDEELSVLKEALQIISDAVELGSSFISNNIVEVWFQIQGRLICYCERNKAIQKYVACIETEDERPFILSRTSCLGEPGMSNIRIISVGSLVTCMAMISDEERVACGCLDGKIFIVNLKRSEVENQWQAHDEPVNAIAVASDGRQLVSGSEDNTAKVWMVENGNLVTCFSDHRNPVNGVTLTGDEKRVVSVSRDGIRFVWDVETAQILSEPIRVGNGSSVTCMTTLPFQDDVVVTGGQDGKLCMWNMTTGAQVGATFEGHDSKVECLAVTPNGRRVLSGSWDETVKVWDVGSHQQIGPSLQHADMITCLAVSGDGRRLLSGTFYKLVRVWDLESQAEICEPLKGHVRRISGVSFLGGANRLVSCAMDCTVRVWDLTRSISRELTSRHEYRVTNVSFTPDGRFVVSGSYDHTLRIWDTTSGAQVGEPLEGHSDRVTDVAVTPSGQSVVSVSWDRTIRVWDVDSRLLLHTSFTGHSDCIRCVAVTPQGNQVVTGSDDGTVQILGLPVLDGDPILFDGHSACVRRVFVSNDGLRVVSVDEEDRIIVWELETLKVVQQREKEDAWKLSREAVLRIVGEIAVHDDAMLSIPRYSRKIEYNEGPDTKVLATFDANIDCWALSPDKKTICVGLEDGQVAFLNLKI